MSTESFEVRTMRRDELDLVVQWAQREGWNPGLGDAACFYATDPGGFLLGTLDGRPVASISVVEYEGDFAFLGFFIVEPALRGRGFGRRIWDAGMRRIAGRNIGLDGVVEQQAKYRRSGFELAYRNIRYQGVRPASVTLGSSVVPIARLSMDAVVRYDETCFPAPRRRFVEAWLCQARSRAYGITRDGHLRGYGMIRPSAEGYRVGPLFADDAGGAEGLLAALLAGIPAGERFFLDVPEVNAAAGELVRRHGMARVFETARMYTGVAPALPLERIYGVTSFELG